MQLGARTYKKGITLQKIGHSSDNQFYLVIFLCSVTNEALIEIWHIWMSIFIVIIITFFLKEIGFYELSQKKYINNN